MRRTDLLQEIRKMKFEEVYEGWNEGRLTQAEAAQILGMCERGFRRYLSRYEAEGLDGLIDRRLEQVLNRRAPTMSGPMPTTLTASHRLAQRTSPRNSVTPRAATTGRRCSCQMAHSSASNTRRKSLTLRSRTIRLTSRGRTIRPLNWPALSLRVRAAMPGEIC